MSAGTTDKTDNRYGISRTSGVLISCAAIAISTPFILGLTYLVLPSALDDAVGVLIASLLIPVIAAFRPLQTFVILPDGLGFDSIFSRRLYKVQWTDVTDVRLKRSIFGFTNLELKQKNSVLHRKVPLTIMPKRKEFLLELIETFPPDHAQRTLLDHIVQSYLIRIDSLRTY